jgi:hypothetical protein
MNENICMYVCVCMYVCMLCVCTCIYIYIKRIISAVRRVEFVSDSMCTPHVRIRAMI